MKSCYLKCFVIIFWPFFVFKMIFCNGSLLAYLPIFCMNFLVYLFLVKVMKDEQLRYECYLGCKLSSLRVKNQINKFIKVNSLLKQCIARLHLEEFVGLSTNCQANIRETRSHLLFSRRAKTYHFGKLRENNRTQFILLTRYLIQMQALHCEFCT